MAWRLLLMIGRNNQMKLKSFTDDAEKMRDFKILTKEEFLNSYSYITEEEYNLTLKEVAK